MSVNSDTRGLTRQSVIGRPYQASPFPDGSNQSLPNQPTSVHLPYTSKPFIAPHPLLVAPTTALPPTHVQTRLAPETFPRHDPFATKLVKAKIVAPDLLSIPLDAAVLGLAKAGAPSQAPPIPPNPEKDAVLSALLAALRHKHAATLDNNGEALVSLRSQNQALLEARQWLQNELDEVSDLQAAAESNERILQEAMRKADVVMEDARQRTVPSVDEILMAPTRVGNQLYETCAEEVALREALFVLTKALDAGRIGVDSFFKVCHCNKYFDGYPF